MFPWSTCKNLVPSNGPRPTGVNTSLENVPFKAALDSLLLPFGYVAAHRDGQYFIGPSDPESPLFSIIAEHVDYVPKHMTPDDILEALPERQRRYVRVVEAANRIVVDAPRRDAQLILSRFEQVDQPVPQVVLEAIVCVIAPDSGFRFGVDWNHHVHAEGADLLRMGATGLALSGTITQRGVSQILDDFASTSTDRALARAEMLINPLRCRDGSTRILEQKAASTLRARW